ncbi:TFIIB-type zinc ribbon-containing protein [Methylomonas rhizoryzae]|uniref:TFIIB-type zinc ribbon-containing protein n=1 Tax=Methylomonas rhizoryzae TaxID=2608981 RepID=UPI0012328D1D|nr:zf-TFIIB domain-containing protein [Methylomonas rhizoryzae]
MAKCQTCSAPLAANTQICLYCGVRNDVDLHGKLAYQPAGIQHHRICPQCDLELQTIALSLAAAPLELDRCPSCFGLFFDPGEVEILLDHADSPAIQTNSAWLDNINLERFPKDKTVRYLKCPVCREFMKRTLYGHRSGVVIDRCMPHGIWLDPGEISHLLEWQTAGGRLLDEKKKQQRPQKPPARQTRYRTGDDNSTGYSGNWGDENNLIQTVADLIFTLFR